MKRSMINFSLTAECISGVPSDKNISPLAGELKNIRMKKNPSFTKTFCLSILSFAFMSLSFISCDKKFSNSCENGQQAVLKNMTGLDGCGWMIQLGTERLEPINLADFDIELIENKPVCVQYRERKDLASTCMAGKIVEIIKIE